MQVLVVMSALALVAVLWAMSSIIRHIYKSRRRSRFLRERRPQSWADPIFAPLPQISLRDPSPAVAGRVIAAQNLSAGAPGPIATLEELLPALTIVEATEPQTAFSSLATKTFDDRPYEQSHSVETPTVEVLGVTAPQPDTFLRRPVRSVYPQSPATPLVLPLRRPDWLYFNKDMGDLSDPSPGRVRDRVRAR